MSGVRVRRALAQALAFSCATLFLASGSANAQLTSQELKCSKALVKSAGKLYSTILKSTTKCRDADISGKADDPGLCSPLTGKSAEKVAKAREKLRGGVAKACASVCSASTDIVCTHDLDCPPVGSGAQRCTGDASSNPFSRTNLGFPGPYCEAVLGHEIENTNDIADCTASVVESVAAHVLENVYADADDGTGLSEDAAQCLSKLGKVVSKGPAKIAGAIGKCRDSQNGADNRSVLADACVTNDEGVLKAILKNIGKANKTVEKSCTTGALAELNLCGEGTGAITDFAGAQECLGELVVEAADSENLPADRSYIPINLIEAAYPEAGVASCGDGLLNEGRTSFNGVGEECEVGNEAACGAGSCFPPGDAWECTCDNTPRMRLSVDGAATDSDAGWTGNSHDAVHVDGQGFVADLSNCDCDSLDAADCVGSTSDSTCDVAADTAPRCSGPFTGLSCDEQGDMNDSFENSDCYVCDADSINAGDHCADGDGHPDESLCQSRCFDNATGLPVDPETTCNSQTDCGAGKTCRGRCDNTQTCDLLVEGAPLPLISANTAVCVQLAYFSDIEGTRDLITGQGEFFYDGRSLTHFGISQASPCPQCEGVCLGGGNDGKACVGRCDVSDEPCLDNEDCVGIGDTACLETTPECPDGSCRLAPVCTAGPNEGRACRPQADTPFGVVSADCPPDPNKNITGGGTKMGNRPLTTGTVQLNSPVPCTAQGFSNFDCPCPDDGGTPSKPNTCNPACNAGPNYLERCPAFSSCVGGDEPGAACDEDLDCSGDGTCTGTPDKCTAGGLFKINTACTTNADCDSSPGSGNGVCEPSCPGGLCTPLCVAQGECDGASAFPGRTCAVNADCAGGTCGPSSDDDDGVCAAGPVDYRCTGAGFTGQPCLAANVGTQIGCELGPDGTPGTVDDLVGAGECRPAGNHECFLNGGFAEGGDTINGNGSPTDVNMVAIHCTPRGVSAVNPVSGFGGPQRLRRRGTLSLNTTSIQ